MLGPLKSMVKRCLRPVYRRLPGRLRVAISRYRAGLAPGGASLTGVDTAALNGLLAHLQETDRLLLAALTPPTSPPAPAFRAVPLGNGRLLADHPYYPFLYLDSHDLTVTPWVVAGRCDLELTLLLARLVRPGDTVWDVGAGPGYHTLSLAHLVGPTGRVVAVEGDAACLDVLRDNVAAHELAEMVTLYTDATALPRGAEPRPDLIRIDRRFSMRQLLARWSAGEWAGARVLLSLGSATEATVLRDIERQGATLALWTEGGLEEVPARDLPRAARGERRYVVVTPPAVSPVAVRPAPAA